MDYSCCPTSVGQHGGQVCSSVRTLNSPDLSACATAAEEALAAIGLKPRHTRSRRHYQFFPGFPGVWVNASQFAFVVFPAAMPQLAVHPGDAGDEAVAFDGAQDGAGVRVDLMNFPVLVLADPQAAFCPSHAGVAVARCRDAGEDFTGFRVEFLNAVLGDLIEVLAVSGGAGVGGSDSGGFGRRQNVRGLCAGAATARACAALAGPGHNCTWARRDVFDC